MSQELKKMRRRSLSKRARQEGMTLIEIMIVVIIMAMIATGVAVAVMPQFERSQVNSAKIGVQAIRSAVSLYLAENPGKCPTAEELKEEKYLDKNKSIKDPWDKDYIITCEAGDDPEVYSMGPDMQEGTEDDVR